MKKNLFKILFLFISFCVGSVINCFADTDLGNGVTYSGKVKNGQLAGKGDLILRGDYGQVMISLSGNFTTTENGKVQVIGDLYFSDTDQPTFQNANFEFSTQTPYSICVKSGATINTESIKLFTPDGSEKQLSNLVGHTTTDGYLTISPETKELQMPSDFTLISYDTPLNGAKYTGYVIWNHPYYIVEEMDDSHYTQYKSSWKGYIIEMNRNGDDWVKFDNENHHIENFSKSVDGKCLSGDFSGTYTDTSGNTRFVKYNGYYTDGNTVYTGEFQLPVDDVSYSEATDNMKAYGRINVAKQPEFLSFKKEIVNGAKIHKRLKLTEGGTILSHINLNDLNSVDSLTVVGIMYTSDMNIIGDMSNLEYLDLSNAFITYSPKEKEKLRAEREFQDVFVKMMSEMNENKRNDRDISRTQYEQNKLLLEILNQTKDVEPKSDPCFVPKIKSLPALETVILPRLAQWISEEAFKDCPNLETVVLPEYLESIHGSCFQHCVKLKNLKFPSTLNSIYMGNHQDLPFFGCSSLEEIDFGECTFKDPDKWYRFPECDDLKKFVFPKNTVEGNFSINNNIVCEIYYPATLKTCSVNTQNSSKGKAKLHFVSKIPPRNDGVSPERCPVLYIPQGSLTEYYSVFGKDFKFVEE